MAVSNYELELKKFLTTDSYADDNNVWDAGFTVDRQVVYARFGVFKRVFLRPQTFIKRFYHHLYPLLIENWTLLETVPLYDGFCEMNIKLDIRFQATLDYAQANIELLAELNEHIKTAFHTLIINLVHQEIQQLDKNWVQDGLTEVEKKIAVAVSELLILHNIQSQALCYLKPEFKQFPDIEMAQENVYLQVLKRSFEFTEEKQQQLLRQQQQDYKHQLLLQKQQLQHINQKTDLKYQQRLFKRQHENQLLEKKQALRQQKQALETNLYQQKLTHKHKLQNLKIDAEILTKEQSQQKLRAFDKHQQLDQLEHQQQLNQQQLKHQVEKYEHQNELWNKAKKQAHTQKVKRQQQQQRLELETEIENHKRQQRKRLAMQKKLRQHTEQSEQLLRQDIEVLKLEKQRLELELAVKAIQKRNQDLEIEKK